MASPASVFTEQEKTNIVAAIAQAEKTTSAEIRVHVENHCKGEVLDRAVEVFRVLGMEKTERRNGVLIYIALKDHKSAIIGDTAVNRHVHHDFWTQCHRVMTDHFRQNEFAAGIQSAIRCLEIELRSHFPVTPDDVNELPDEISFGG